MKRSLLALAAVTALTAIPSAAFADLAFNVGATSDYRYRGISQTRLKPALQAGVDFSAGGFYVGAWASNIKWIEDFGGDAKVEVDLYGGFDLHLGQEVHDVFSAAVQLGVALLAAETLHFRHRDALHPDAAQRFANFVQLERLDDRGHHLHGHDPGPQKLYLTPTTRPALPSSLPFTGDE